jgi:2-polyprenyl-6-methoxyphenol hydroxylase-like FAD-dependent oxidoreductase
MDFDVVVAGAGPVGLMLAGELRLRGVSVLVVERLTEPSNTLKAGSVNVPTAEACDRRGLLEKLAEVHAHIMEQMSAFAGKPAGGAPQGKPAGGPPPRRLAGHFAGLWDLDIDRLDLTDPDFQAGPAAMVSVVPQQALEQILGDWATKLGVEIRRGVELTGFTGDESGVTVELAPSGTVRAGWLVGCDGGRSVVRKLAGFDFPGTDPVITGHQAIVELADPEKLPKGWNRTPVGMLVYGPGPGRILTVDFAGPPADRDAPVTLAELQAGLRHVSGTDVTITAVHSATRFTDNARQASTYRRGRVLLAGDAAHVHSPFSGQGLNLGIGDAVNLGWKLAGAVQGWAPTDLLDSYTTERHPIGAWVLEWTRAQVALMRPDALTGALRDVITDLMGTQDGNTYFIKKIAGVDRNYDLGGGHPLVGKRAPELELADGTRLADHCHDGRALLLDLTDDAELRELAATWTDRVQVLTTTAASHPDLTGLLVRPDGHVAWAAETAGDRETLATALSRWFGVPATVAVS